MEYTTKNGIALAFVHIRCSSENVFELRKGGVINISYLGCVASARREKSLIVLDWHPSHSVPYY